VVYIGTKLSLFGTENGFRNVYFSSNFGSPFKKTPKERLWPGRQKKIYFITSFAPSAIQLFLAKKKCSVGKIKFIHAYGTTHPRNGPLT
jgi:hypothetical protein